MKIAYFDCIAGVTGDMILGALVDAGLPMSKLEESLKAIRITDFTLTSARVNRKGFSATKVDVVVAENVPERHLTDVERIVARSELKPELKEKAIAIFRRLCTTEAHIHGSSSHKIHLHEISGVDTMVDVFGTLLGLGALGIDRVYASPVPLGQGFIKGGPGLIPLPAPATLALLKGVPVVGRNIEAELVSPTGALLLTSLCESFGPIPPMTLRSVGYGAGLVDLEVPNIIRLILGEDKTPVPVETESIYGLETSIEKELLPRVTRELYRKGAVDVFQVPVLEEKHRTLMLCRVLAPQKHIDELRDVLLTESSGFSVYRFPLQCHVLPHKRRRVQTKYGKIHIDVAHWSDGHIKVVPDYDDCCKAAESKNISVRDIWRAAIEAAGE